MTYDQAKLRIFNQINDTIFIWKRITECEKCPLLFDSKVEINSNSTVKINTNYEYEFVINQNSNSYLNSSICKGVYSLYDQGLYYINITEANNRTKSCQLETINEGRNNIWPLIGAIIIYLIIALVFYGGRRTIRKLREKREINISEPTDPTTVIKNENTKKRLKSLDCFRGITILMMIFANYGCGGYEVLEHIPWDGIHFADFIFPWFIFIMGTTMAISCKSIVIRQKLPFLKIFWKITKRSLKLFIIGVMLSSSAVGGDIYKMRIPGVLQRFGASYFVVATLHTTSLYLYKGELIGPFRFHQLIDIIPYYIEWIAMFILTLIYFTLTFLWKYDTFCPAGYVGPGGLHDNASHYNCTGGAANYIDQWVLSRNHLYGSFTARHIYDPSNSYHLIHDPEGILGTTNSILLTFIGLQIGKILIAYPNPMQRIKRWSIWCLILLALTFLALPPPINFIGYVPINKNLWSFTFITLTGSAAILMLMILYYLIDIKKIWPDGQPFHYPGMNSILLYIGHELTSGMFPFQINFEQNSSHIQPLISNLIGVSLWLIISVVLAKKQIFVTL